MDDRVTSNAAARRRAPTVGGMFAASFSASAYGQLVNVDAHERVSPL
jgi:hypothetical protein